VAADRYLNKVEVSRLFWTSIKSSVKGRSQRRFAIGKSHQIGNEKRASRQRLIS
jgi:hypothetical protein